MPSHAPAKQQDAADDVEVYANGVAFDVVKGWLGRAGEDLEFDQWFGVEDVDADRPARQERLGLGAKFLSHEKASRLTGAVHKKLGKVLARSQRRRDEEEEFINYNGRMSEEWLGDLKQFKTDHVKPFIENAPGLIIVFKHSYEKLEEGKKSNYYVNESVGIAVGMLLSALHEVGLVALTHTPSPMNFLYISHIINYRKIGSLF